VPFVLDGAEGRVEVEAHGQQHLVTLTVDRIRQQPLIGRNTVPSDVTAGAVVRLHWPGSASSILADSKEHFFTLTAHPKARGSRTIGVGMTTASRPFAGDGRDA